MIRKSALKFGVYAANVLLNAAPSMSGSGGGLLIIAYHFEFRVRDHDR